MFIVPTYKRPERLKNLIKAYTDTKATASVYVLIQGNAEMYAGIEYPDTWIVEQLENNIGLVGALNYAFNKYPQEKWYGGLCDDQVPQDNEWDKKLIEAVNDWNIVTSQDAYNKNESRMSGITLFGGELIRACQFMLPPCTWHLCGDDWWELVAKTCNNWVKTDVKSSHFTPETTGIEPDETYKSSYTDFSGQVSRYNQWLAEEGTDLLSKIQKQMP
jgi:hypothetical protein